MADSSNRYQALQNEEEPLEVSESGAEAAPPPYSSIAVESAAHIGVRKSVGYAATRSPLIFLVILMVSTGSGGFSWSWDFCFSSEDSLIMQRFGKCQILSALCQGLGSFSSTENKDGFLESNFLHP
ncbi:hypothetical protein scyTo_0015212 [Scyliorhinus torazame]|uniref:Uncharacterized protein n=1 Tax=Scyliorhinus torazame TaxID=75743 RepID=A0A401P5E9_SCYTO|nr:hypothetical protein [Scyliorhinus torazame]